MAHYNEGQNVVYGMMAATTLMAVGAYNAHERWPDPIGWSGFNLSSCSALGLLPGQMTVLLRLLAQAR